MPSLPARSTFPRVTEAFLNEMLDLFQERPEHVLALMAPLGGVQAQDHDGRTLLLWAAERFPKKAPLIRRLLAAGADVNHVDRHFNTALSLSFDHMRFGNLEPIESTVKALLNAGAHPEYDHRNIQKFAETPLHHAVMTSCVNKNLMNALLNAGTDVNAVDTAGNTPLFLALKGYDLDVEKRLIAGGADVNHRNNAGWSPLMIAINGELSAFEKGKRPTYDRRLCHERAELLLNAGADATARYVTPSGSTQNVLDMVATDDQPNVDLFCLLVRFWADPHGVSPQGLILPFEGLSPHERLMAAIDRRPLAEQVPLRVALERFELQHVVQQAEQNEPILELVRRRL